MELLVVMSILAVLMGILVPVVGKAREKARMTECLSLLRQIGIAVTGYANEHGGCLPVCARLFAQPQLGLGSLPDVLGPHLDTPEAYHCPCDRGPSSCFTQFGTSYEWNTFLNGKKIHRATMRIVGLEVVAPMLGDAELVHGEFGRNYLYLDGRVSRSLELLIRGP